MTDTKEYTFYTFICKDPNITDSYVGSTRAFRKRKSQHKSHCNNESSKKHHLKIYQTIRANGGWDNWEMKPIDIKICSLTEARIHETKLMEERNATLNCIRSFISQEQLQLEKKERSKKWLEENKAYVQERSRIYCLKNKERRNKQAREWYYANKKKNNDENK